MKSISFGRLLALTFSYFLILFFIFSILAVYETLDSSDLWQFNVIFLSFILLPLYIILYNRPWIVMPAKIIFSIVSLILLYIYYSLFGAIDISSFFLFALVPLYLTTGPLYHLYKNNLKNWIIFLRSKPFFDFKNKTEISRQDIILFILTIIIIHLIDWNTLIIERWFGGTVLYPALITILIPAYLFLKQTPLKSIIRLLIYFTFGLFIFAMIDFLSSIGWGGSNFFLNVTYFRAELFILLTIAYVLFFSKDNRIAIESRAM